MQVSKPVMICFPGFLGLPSDYKVFENLEVELEIVDICGNDAPEDQESWGYWEAALISRLDIKYSSRSVVCLGYSMGARICLSLLRLKPAWLKAAVLMSCHPGLMDDHEKACRLQSDMRWGAQFHASEWEPLLQLWNGQPVFDSSNVASRLEVDFDRSNLARVLITFSLAKQDELQSASILIPTLILWGEYDLKYRDLSAKLKDLFSKVEVSEVPQSGHRLLLDAPNYVSEVVSDFVKRSLGL